MLIKIFIFLIFITALMSGNFISYGAQFNYPWTGITEIGGSGGLVAKFYQIALALVGVAAFGVMVYGGILYTISAGNSSTQQDAIAWLTSAALGMVLLLGAYLLLYIINPGLTDLTPPRVGEVKISPVYSTSSAAFQSAIHTYNIDQCLSGWQQVSNSSCDNLGVQRQDPPYNRPNAPQVCCKMK